MSKYKNQLIIVIILFSFVFVFVSYFKITYPIKYIGIINENCKAYNLDVCQILSVINIESNFDKEAHSKANALGLMQIRLQTANDMAKRNNAKLLEEKDLFDAEINIEYGCCYLRYLLDYYNNIELALCAYNAGLGNVNNWLKMGIISNNIVIENIPFIETRNYIKKYRKNLSIYKFYRKIGLIKY